MRVRLEQFLLLTVTIFGMTISGLAAERGQHLTKQVGNFTVDIYGWDNGYVNAPDSKNARPIEKFHESELGCALNQLSEVVTALKATKNHLRNGAKIQIDLSEWDQIPDESNWPVAMDEIPQANGLRVGSSSIYLRPVYGRSPSDRNSGGCQPVGDIRVLGAMEPGLTEEQLLARLRKADEVKQVDEISKMLSQLSRSPQNAWTAHSPSSQAKSLSPATPTAENPASKASSSTTAAPGQ